MALRFFGLVFFVALLGGCGPQISSDDLPALPTIATDRFVAGVKDQLDSLSTAVSNDPLNATKTGQLGMAYLAYQLDDAAAVVLQRAHLLRPRAFKWMYYQTEALSRVGRYTESVSLLQQAIARKPQYVPARIHLGLLHMQLGDLPAARTYLTAVVDDRPENTEARLALARLHLRADEPVEARTHLEYIVEKAGPAGNVYFSLAEVWRRLGDRQKATEYLALFEKYRGVGLAIDDPLLRAVADLDLSEKPLLRQARRLNQLGQTDKAIELMHLALARNPDSHLTHAALVGAYGAMKQFDKVDEHYRLALESAPATAALLRNLGRARVYERRITEAREALERALDLNPHDSSALAWLGVVRLQQSDTEEGMALLADALEKNPRASMARHNLADVLRKQGRHAEALIHMKELVIVEDKHSPRVWRQMGESHMVLGQTELARDALTAAVASAHRMNDDTEARRSASLLERIQ